MLLGLGKPALCPQDLKLIRLLDVIVTLAHFQIAIDLDSQVCIYE